MAVVDAVLLLLVLAAAAGVVAAVSRSRAGTELGPGPTDPSYRHALEMARILERLLGDEMVRCTIAPEVEARMRTAVDGFYGDPPALPPPR